ncbi:MAG: CoA-binding protein [Deltaproteobacteria bacterium]|nr:CoA-binding protein [Candidatus Zymogenaceae bacterium]
MAATPTPFAPFWKSVFLPQTVALVGKTNPAKGGSMFLLALVNQGYTGKVFVVSTDGGPCGPYESFNSIDELPAGIEYAILCVPANRVPDTLRDIAKKGIRAAHVFSSGFGDLETDEGRRLEAELKRASQETGVRVIGPNCLGVFSPAVGIAFPPGIFPKGVGNVGMVSQSGGTTQALIWCGAHYAYRVNKAVSLGNTVDLSVEDFLEHMIDDSAVEIIAVYLEGSTNPRRFMELVKRGSATKPVVILKVGMSDAGAKAASSHTGIMAGSGPLWDAAVRQAGGIRVSTFEELVGTVSAFAKRRGTVGRRIALVNRGGGEGVVAADVLPGMGLTVAPFSQQTQQALASIIPSEGTGFINPIDFSLVGGLPGVFEKMFAIIDDDSETDMIIYQHQIEFAHLFKEGYNEYLLDALATFATGAKKTVLVVLPLYYSGDEWLRSLIYLNERGVSTHPTIQGAGAAAENLARWQERSIQNR